MSVELSVLIPQYARNKKELNYYKELCEKQNNEIKVEMSKAKLPTFEAEDYTASLSTSTRESLIEDKLIELLKEHKIRGVVKKKEFVDMDALEKAIYSGKIPKEVLADMDNCKIYKQVTTLRVTKNKPKKAEAD